MAKQFSSRMGHLISPITFGPQANLEPKSEKIQKESLPFCKPKILLAKNQNQKPSSSTASASKPNLPSTLGCKLLSPATHDYCVLARGNLRVVTVTVPLDIHLTATSWDCNYTLVRPCLQAAVTLIAFGNTTDADKLSFILKF